LGKVVTFVARLDDVGEHCGLGVAFTLIISNQLSLYKDASSAPPARLLGKALWLHVEVRTKVNLIVFVLFNIFFSTTTAMDNSNELLDIFPFDDEEIFPFWPETFDPINPAKNFFSSDVHGGFHSEDYLHCDTWAADLYNGDHLPMNPSMRTVSKSLI
jgi:hypothetical protein